MNSSIARLLKRYASTALPETVKKKAPVVVHLLYKWLKQHWNGLSHKERGAFKRHIKADKSLPEAMKVLIRKYGIPLEWPPKPPEVSQPRRWRGKPHSWQHKRYGGGRHVKN